MGCARYGSGVRYNDGTRYCNVELLPAYFLTRIDDGEHGASPHYVGLTIKHSGPTRFTLHDVRLVASPKAITKHQYFANIDRVGLNRISLTVKHADASAFRLDNIRLHGSIKQQRSSR